jgi:hypothetical protein
MILPLLAAAASSPGRSVAGWAYDVKKSFASAIVVAWNRGRGQGHRLGNVHTSEMDRIVGAAALAATEMVIILGGILSGVPDSLADVFRLALVIAVGAGIVAVFRDMES